jgi:hypothetical protein
MCSIVAVWGSVQYDIGAVYYQPYLQLSYERLPLVE